MSTTKRPPLLLREEFEGMLLGLPAAERGELISAMMAYQWRGEEPTLQGKLEGIFLALRSFIDSDAVKYERKCRQNSSNVQKRRDR